MKKSIVLTIIFSLLSPFYFAHAQNIDTGISGADSQFSKTALEQKLQTEISTRKHELETAKNDLKNRLSQETAVLVDMLQNASEQAQDAFIQKITVRVNISFARLNNLAYRIQARIDKINKDGGDTTNAQADLLEAETNLSGAEKEFEAFDFSMASIQDITNSAAEIQSLKASLTNIQQELGATVKELEIIPQNIPSSSLQQTKSTSSASESSQ